METGTHQQRQQHPQHPQHPQHQQHHHGDGGDGYAPSGESKLDGLKRKISGRKRKASLRKGILGKNMLRDRRDSHNHGRDSARTAKTPAIAIHTQMAGLDSSCGSASLRDDLTPRQLASPVRRTSGTYASTTDEDDALSSYGDLPLPLSPAKLLQRRRSNRSALHTSPITVPVPVSVSVPTPDDLAPEDEWDYSETEWWGWVILVVTWLVFVVGMGSCLDVWTWAWDVGETPYAPPELEDDPTLPITGYYPALMVCTVVMAWIWVVIAWVGMKYFRHAKVVADDG
ncbi:hypothetical protein P280DRAFT_174808 [Massarina eburnea CBS 473.64]|uniref:Uncharacterized protein n=1 Tax=Massarina eburnea CBS 473.64 TaxID=1395130 RepID=A0A6A6SBK5_9PLEO|nr:hypothetical protein P280DRAFT_174808 [Massarina eburnea CBS 473.64]